MGVGQHDCEGSRNGSNGIFRARHAYNVVKKSPYPTGPGVFADRFVAVINSIILFFLGLLVTGGSTPYVIALSRRGIGLDRPEEKRKQHDGEIPRLGGAPIMLSVSLALVIIYLLSPTTLGEWFPVMVGSVMMYALGLWDDLQPLGAKKKLIGQLMAAGTVYALGLRVELISYPGGLWPVELGYWSIPATIFWLIAVPNIVNLIDGFDGLASGLGLVMAITLGIVGLTSQQLPVAWLAFALAGSLLGFLVFNFPPAKIFLGDGGAYLIGFLIAALSLTSSQKGSVATVLAVTVVALGVPILDTLFALGRRAVRGYPLFHADDEHLHHKLQNLGFSKKRILLGLYGVCVTLSLVGLSIIWSQGRTLPIALAVFCLLAVLALRYLHLVRSFADARIRMGRNFSRRSSVRYALLQAQVLEIEVDRCSSPEAFWKIFGDTMGRIGFLREDESTNESAVRIPMKYNGSSPWVLVAPPNTGHEVEWYRLAEVFRPAFIKAVRKWHLKSKTEF